MLELVFVHNALPLIMFQVVRLQRFYLYSPDFSVPSVHFYLKFLNMALAFNKTPNF